MTVFTAHWTGKLLGEVLLISFVLQMFGLVGPLFVQVVIDQVQKAEAQRLEKLDKQHFLSNY